MIRIAFRFPSGRFHATPWGRHVNEGAIEWPPSPWRIYRALLATGWSRHGWDAVPSEAAELLATMCEATPEYFVEPSTGTGHTRHYMPKFKGATDKVIDTFLVLPRDRSSLVVEWAVDVTDSMRRMLEALLASLPYLGRAESPVDAVLTDSLPSGLVRCGGGESAPTLDHRRIDLLAPLRETELVAWRTRALEAAKEELAPEVGGRAPSKGQSTPVGRYPANLIEVLQADTLILQKAGWSQPPGSRWLTYWIAPPQTFTRAPRRSRAVSRPDTAVLALSPDTAGAATLPLMRDALIRAELVHMTLVRKSDDVNDGNGPSACFSGCDAEHRPLRGHRHASVLPISLAGVIGPSARIDHVVVQAPMGFDEAAVAAIRQTRKTYGKGLPPIFMTLVGLGRRAEMTQVLGCGVIWESVTPFVPPRYLKPRGRNCLRGQIQEELAARGLPPPSEVQVQLEDGTYTSPEQAIELARAQRAAFAFGSTKTEDPERPQHPRLATQWRHFRSTRTRGGTAPPSQIALGLRLVFSEPVIGPVSFGYGSHFGLGQLRLAG